MNLNEIDSITVLRAQKKQLTLEIEATKMLLRQQLPNTLRNGENILKNNWKIPVVFSTLLATAFRFFSSPSATTNLPFNHSSDTFVNGRSCDLSP